MNTHPVVKTSWGLLAVLAVLFLLSLSLFSYENYQASRADGLPAWQLAGNIALSALMLAVPLALFYFSIYLLVTVYQQKRRQGQITGRLATWLYRTPRIAGILIAAFVGMFALDVFSMEGSIWLRIGAFLLHASPALLLAGLVALAWRHEWIGALAFLIGAVYFLRLILGGRGFENLGSLLLFSGPMLAIALLFWVNWRWKKEIIK